MTTTTVTDFNPITFNNKRAALEKEDITVNVSKSTASAVAGNSADVSKLYTPQISPYARGVAPINSSIAITNKNLVHSCDFALAIEKNGLLRKYIRAIAKWIREGIRKMQLLMSSTDSSGVFSQIIDALQSIAEFVQYINDEFIQPIIEFEKYVIAVIVKIRAIIQWLLSLPAKLLALLRDCLTALLKTLGSIFMDEWAAAGKEVDAELGVVPKTDSGKGFSELTTAAKNAYDATVNLLSATTTAAGLAVGIAVSGTVGLIAPVTEEDIDGANATIIEYTGTIPPALEVPADPDFLKKSTP